MDSTRQKRIIILSFISLLLVVSILVYFGQRKAKLKELYYSGTIEATQAELAFQTGGRVVNVLVDEGHSVKKDQILAELALSEYRTRYEEAKANLERATKNLRQLKTMLEIYQKTLPAEVERAKASVLSDKDIMEEARKNKQRYDKLFREGVVSERELDTVTLNYDTARARLSENEAILKQAQSNLRKIEATEKEIEAARA